MARIDVVNYKFDVESILDDCNEVKLFAFDDFQA